MFIRIGRAQVATGGPRARRIARGTRGAVARLLGAASLAAIAVCVLGGGAAAYAASPTVTGVSPDTGPPAGGTTVTVTGSGFALGESATRITFGEITEGEEGEEVASGVNCPTTTECTVTAPELPPASPSVVDVRATVDGVSSPQTAADRFHYRGLNLVKNGARIGADEGFVLRGLDYSREAGECSGFASGGIASNGESTDVIHLGAAAFTSCSPDPFFDELPFSFALSLHDDGSATVEGPMGVRTFSGCVYEGDQLAGHVGLDAPLSARLDGTFLLVAEEEPGAECAATESVEVAVETENGNPPYVELVAAPPPNVTAVSPGGGPKAGGTSVTITGTGFEEASKVMFGSVEAASFTVNSPTSITAVSPPGEGIAAVTVTTPDGTSPAGAGGDGFTYGPGVSAIEPDDGLTTGERTITITGVDLGGASAVTFGTTPATSFTVVSPTSVTAVSPAGTGTVDVTVTTPEGTSPTSAADRFTYVPAPTVTGLSPDSGSQSGGTSTTITGTNLTDATAVTFGATAAVSFKVDSATTITAVSPAGAGTVDVTVSVPAGTSAVSTSDEFHYLAGPEYGRCLKLARGAGLFENSKCANAGGTKTYEWYPAAGGAQPLAKARFTTKIKELTEAKLYTAGRHVISCTGETGSGEYSGPKSVADIAITLTGCQLAGVGSCQSTAAAPGEVVLSTLEGELGVIATSAEGPLKNTIGTDLKPASGTTLAAFACAGTPVLVAGSAIAEVPRDSMKSTATLKLVASAKGIQKPSRFEGGEEDVLLTKVGEGGASEASGLKLTMIQTNEEAVEVNSVV